MSRCPTCTFQHSAFYFLLPLNAIRAVMARASGPARLMMHLLHAFFPWPSFVFPSQESATRSLALLSCLPSFSPRVRRPPAPAPAPAPAQAPFKQRGTGTAEPAPAADSALTGAAAKADAADADIEASAAKRQRTDSASADADAVVTDGNAADGAVATVDGSVDAGGAADEDSAANLEASLQSCTAHRDRIVQMLLEEPNNTNLIDLRNQLTNAINQLQVSAFCLERSSAHSACTSLTVANSCVHWMPLRASVPVVLSGCLLAGHKEHGTAREERRTRCRRRCGDGWRRLADGQRALVA